MLDAMFLWPRASDNTGNGTFSFNRALAKQCLRAWGPCFLFEQFIPARVIYLRTRFPRSEVCILSYGDCTWMKQLLSSETGGDADAEKFIAAARGLKWMSPRGPVEIDPATRDIVQTVYIRKVEKVGGKLQNIEFDQVPEFKDPGKQ